MADPGSLSTVDPIALARPALLDDTPLTSMLGGSDRVLSRNQPPYPCVVLTDPPGDDRRRHLIAPLLQVEVFGDLDGTPGKPALRDIAYRVVEVIDTLPDLTYGPGEPVVTFIESAAGVGWSPMPNGQPRYITTLRIYGHPGRVPATP